MKKAINLLFFILAIAILSLSAQATSLATLKVHAVDQDNNDLEGVAAAPEWKLTFTGWNDFLPKERTTGTDGLTSQWLTVKGTKLQIDSAVKEGYSCTSGTGTQIIATSGLNVLTTVCTQNTVPEFGTMIALGLAAFGGLAIFAVRRH